MSGTVIDKATAFKNSITGAGINKIVCKASSHDLSGPKKKHVDCELMERGSLFRVHCHHSQPCFRAWGSIDALAFIFTIYIFLKLLLP